MENPTFMGICIYNNILRDPIVKSYVSLDEALEEKMSPEDICGRYGEFLSNWFTNGTGVPVQLLPMPGGII